MSHSSAAPDATTPYAIAAAGVLFASICFGFVPYFSRGLTDAGMAPFAVAFYRYILAALVMLPALVVHRRHWREILWGMLAGAVMGLGWVGYATALETLPASTVGVLYMTYPVFTVLIAWAMFGDPPTGRSLIAAALIITGAVVAGSPASIPPEQVYLLLVSLAAPFGFGFGICVLVHRLSRIAPLARIAAVSLGSVAGLSPLILTSAPHEILPAEGGGWMLIVGISLITALIPQLIYTICAPVVGATRTAVIGSIELPTMFAVGALAFAETITTSQAIACALVLAAIALTQSRATRTVATTASQPPKK